MVWVVFLVLVIGFAYLMYASESFRRFGWGLIAIVGIGAYFVWQTAQNNDSKYEEERRRSVSAISPSDVGLADLILVPLESGYHLSGTIRNRSAHAIRSVEILVALRDCPSSESRENCLIVGQDDVRIFVDVPAGQARSIGSYVTFEDAAPVTGHWSWTYSLAEIEADLPPPQ